MKKSCKNFIILLIIVANFITTITGYATDVNKSTTPNSASISNRLEELRKKGVLIVATSNEIPFAYIDPKTGSFSGINADILTEVAKRLGINKVEMKQIPFKYLIDDLNNDKTIDIISRLYVTDERKKKVLFTNTWYKESETILTLKSSSLTSQESLKNAIIGAQSGTIFLELAQKLQKDGLVKEVRIYQSQPELILAVATSEIDGAIISSTSATYILSKYKTLPLKILTSYEPKLSGMDAGAVRKDDTALADAINEKIDEMKKDGTLLEILKRYGLNESNFVSVEDGHNSNK